MARVVFTLHDQKMAKKECFCNLLLMKVKDCSCPNNPQTMVHNFFNQSKDIFKFGPFTSKSIRLKSYCKSIHERIIKKLKHSAMFFQYGQNTWQFPPDWFHFHILQPGHGDVVSKLYNKPKKEWHSILILYVHTCINTTTGNIRFPCVKRGGFLTLNKKR